MFNSMARYLWGSAEDEEQQVPLEDQAPVQECLALDLCVEEHLEEHDSDGDWILVGSAGKVVKSLPVGQPVHQRPHPHQSHHSSHDSLSQQFTEAEMLDEAASLILPAAGLSGQLPQPDSDTKSSDQEEDNGVDSGVRPSSPESVFSACSGRSSATYRPHGVESEAWIVAPPPCFTGSRCDNVLPLVSGPLENLLIEHPSMSVYVSQPLDLSSSHKSDSAFQAVSSTSQISGLPAVLSDSTHSDIENSAQRVGDGLEIQNAVQSRDRRGGEKHVVRKQNLRDRVVTQALKAQKSINRNRCRRQNDIYSTPKGRNTNKRNKQMRPSGSKCSRVPQRTFNKHRV